ncbi:MAG: ATP-binding cassette domain-containing protein [Faecalibacillus sp.]
MLKIKHIQLSYGEKIIFHHTDFCAEHGKLTMIIGPSGSGKSTLLDIIKMKKENVYDLYEIDNINIAHLDKDQQKHFQFTNFGIVEQTPVLIKNLTIQKHIELFQSLHNHNIDYQNYVEILELSHILNKYPNQLSGGEKVRVGILLALLHDPDYLILDEPTSSLDRHHTQLIIDLIKQYSSRQKTVIISTHDRLLIDEADCLYRIKDKKLIKKKDKMINEVYKSLDIKTPCMKKMINYIIKGKKYHQLYNGFIMLITALAIAFTAFSLQYANVAKEMNSKSVQSLASNEMLVYKNDNAPFEQEEMKRISNISDVESYAIFYNENSETDANCQVYDGHNIISSKTFMGIGNTDEYFFPKTSVYNKKSNISYLKYFDQEGAVVTEGFLEKLGIEVDKWQKNYEVEYIIQVPLYIRCNYGYSYSTNTAGDKLVGSFGNMYDITTINVPIRFKVRGIVEYSFHNRYVDVYFDKDLVDEYIEQYRPQEEKRDTYLSYDPEVGEYEAYSIYTAYQPNCLNVLVNDVLNIESVKKQLIQMGYEVETPYSNYTAILEIYNSFTENLTNFSAIIIVIIIILTLILKFIKNKDIQREKRIYRTYGFTEKEISLQSAMVFSLDAIILWMFSAILTFCLCVLSNEIFAKQSISFGYTNFNYIMFLIITGMVFVFEVIIPFLMNKFIHL